MSGKKDRTSLWLIAGLLVLVGVAAFMVIASQLQPRANIALGEGMFKSWVVRTKELREKGLGGVDHLADNEAMLFLFDTSDKWAIWMKDMKIPLDIVWLDQNQKVIYIVKGASPDDFPKTYVPNDPAQYVLEMSAGSVDNKSIKIGSKAIFDPEEVRRAEQ